MGVYRPSSRVGTARMSPGKYRRKTIIKKPRKNYRYTGQSLKTRQLVNNNAGTIVSFPGYGFPDELIATIAYCDNIILESDVGTPVPTKTYSLNNVYDPDQSLGGHQPMFFDQFAEVYGKYFVVGAKIVVEYTVDQAFATGPWMVGLESVAMSNLTSTNPTSLMECPDASCENIGGDHGTCKVIATYSPQKLGGTWQDDDLGALVSSYPNRQYYAHLWATPLGATTDTLVNASIRIEYRVRFSMRKDNTGS